MLLYSLGELFWATIAEFNHLKTHAIYLVLCHEGFI